MEGKTCNPKMAATLFITPSFTIQFAPWAISSAGWNKNLTFPPNSGAIWESTIAVPKPTVV